MKRLALFVLCAMLCGTVSLSAQEHSLQFIYVVKDHTTRVTPLVKELVDLYDFIRTDNCASAVFYMPDGENPVIVKVNLPGDNRQDMDRILERLWDPGESMVAPFVDVEKIGTLFGKEIPLRDERGSHSFTGVEFVYYVTPSFWSLYYHEQVIAPLWFVLELDQPWARNYVQMSIFHQEDDGLQADSENPFGPMNLCAGYNFQLLTY